MIFIVFLGLFALFLPLAATKSTTAFKVSAMGFVFLYMLLAIINAYHYTFSPLSLDAITFDQQAKHMAATGLRPDANQNTCKAFVYILSLFYRVYSSMMTGQMLSIIGYSFTVLILHKFIQILNLIKYELPILLLFSLDPFQVLIKIGVMRESWELLILMSAVLAFIKVINRENRLMYLTILVVSLLAGIQLHLFFRYFALFTILFFCVRIIIPIYNHMIRTIKNYNIEVIIPVLFLMSVYLLLNVWADGHYSWFFYRQEKMIAILSNISAYTQYIDTHYIFKWYSQIELFYKYMFYPLIIRHFSIVDIYAWFVALCRLILLTLSVQHLKKSFNKSKLVILLSCLCAALIFSQATSNYGTAMRHQILTFWGLCLLGGAELAQFMNTAMKKIKKVNLWITKKRIEVS